MSGNREENMVQVDFRACEEKMLELTHALGVKNEALKDITLKISSTKQELECAKEKRDRTIIRFERGVSILDSLLAVVVLTKSSFHFTKFIMAREVIASYFFPKFIMDATVLLGNMIILFLGPLLSNELNDKIIEWGTRKLMTTKKYRSISKEILSKEEEYNRLVEKKEKLENEIATISFESHICQDMMRIKNYLVTNAVKENDRDEDTLPVSPLQDEERKKHTRARTKNRFPNDRVL